jgi:hypothetical protein
MSKILAILVFAVAIIILIPCATIWSLNTLFPALAIPLTFDTWCAALILGGVAGGTMGLSYKK